MLGFAVGYSHCDQIGLLSDYSSSLITCVLYMMPNPQAFSSSQTQNVSRGGDKQGWDSNAVCSGPIGQPSLFNCYASLPESQPQLTPTVILRLGCFSVAGSPILLLFTALGNVFRCVSSLKVNKLHFLGGKKGRTSAHRW